MTAPPQPRRRIARGSVAVALSVATHGALAALLVGGEPQRPPRRAAPLQAHWVQVDPPPLPPAQPMTAQAPAAEPTAEVPARPKARPRTRRPKASARDDTHAAEAPSKPASAPSPSPVLADFSGMTLSNPAGSWASPQGSGAPMRGPVGPAGAAASTAHTPAGASAAGGAHRETVAAGDLSRPPRPPSLDAELQRLYPESARRESLEGDARLAVTVLASGRVKNLRVLTASDPRFARACEQLLRASHWSPPLDRSGSAVATIVAYRCQFLLD